MAVSRNRKKKNYSTTKNKSKKTLKASRSRNTGETIKLTNDMFGAIKSKIKYVKEKAKMSEITFHKLHKKQFVFKLENVLNDRTFAVYKNLKKKHILDYYFTIQMLLDSGFYGECKVDTDMEALVWTSELLEIFNNHPVLELT